MSVSSYAIKDFSIQSAIGDGNVGKVFAARHHSDLSNSPTTLVAIKIIPRSKVGESARREVDVHFGLDHPNIATLYRVTTASIPYSNFSSPTQGIPLPSPTSLALVMEHGYAGDMFTEVSTAHFLHPSLVRRRLRQIASAVQFLHLNRIVHLDIKLENVILTSDATAKLIDFGCARHLDCIRPRNINLGGTLHYLAPEVVGNPDALPCMSQDAWALGVLIYTALVGNYPFNPLTPSSPKVEDDETKKRILDFPPHPIKSSLRIPSDLVQIIYGLLEKDPSKRMTIPQLLQILESTPDILSRHVNHINSSQMDSPKIGPNSHHQRVISPSGAPDADFAPIHDVFLQTKADALREVDGIIRSRMRSASDINRLFAGMNLRSSVSAPTNRNTQSRHEFDENQNDNL